MISVTEAVADSVLCVVSKPLSCKKIQVNLVFSAVHKMLQWFTWKQQILSNMLHVYSEHNILETRILLKNK